MNLLLVLLACNAFNRPDDKPSDPTDGPVSTTLARVMEPVRIPKGEAVAQRCFVSEERVGRKGSSGVQTAGGQGVGMRSPTTARPSPTSTPTPMPTRSKSAGPLGRLMGGSGAAESAPMAAMPSPPEAEAAPAMDIAAAPPAPSSGDGNIGFAADPSAGEATSGSQGGASLDDGLAQQAPATATAASEPTDKSDRAKESYEADEKSNSRSEAKKDESARALTPRPMRRQPAKPIAVRPPEPQVEWGATTWLSNDDSMSLASAQRLLWAVKNHSNFSTSEVRPHELLNYFSFDTAPVEDGTTFSVLGSAEQTGPDTLTVALAVKGANPPRQPLDLTLVVDVSGSMYAEGRIDYVKRGLHKMEEQLQRGDRVDLVIFDHESCTPLQDYVKGRDDAGLLTAAIDDLTPRGSTDLGLGLRDGYALANRWVSQDSGHDRNHRVMVLTDAQLNTGDIDTDTVSEVARGYETGGIRLTGVGVGREFNDKMLDKLTEKGKGAYVYLGSEAVVDRLLGTGFESLTRTVAHDVRFALDLPDSLGMAKFYGEESSTNPEDIDPINYYVDTTQVFLQDLKIRDGRVISSDPISLRVTWRDPKSNDAREQEWSTTIAGLMEGDRHNVDKARALMSWSDMLLARAMNGNPCGEPMRSFQERTSKVSDDAELAYVMSLTGPLCGIDMSAPTGVSYRVKLDSDVPIAEVALACNGGEQVQQLASGDKVARFSASPGACQLTLMGTVPMIAKVDVPVTGGDVRCVVRGGRLSCS